VTSYNPFPFAPQQRTNDPLLEKIIAPTTTAMVDVITRVARWKTDARCNTLSYEVASQWDRESSGLRAGAVPDLRQAVATDPKLRVLIGHGSNDLYCPFIEHVTTRILTDGDAANNRPDSQRELRQDVRETFSRH